MKKNVSSLNRTAEQVALTLLCIFILSIGCKKELSSENSITQPPPVADTFSIFTNQKPVGKTENDRKGAGIEVGVKFQSSVAGYVDGIRYYKHPVTAEHVLYNFIPSAETCWHQKLSVAKRTAAGRVYFLIMQYR